MRGLLIRLVVIGVVAGGSWVAYQLADVTKCNGPKAEQWAEASMGRIDAAFADMNSVTDHTTQAQLGALALSAKTRYMSQQDQAAPACLSDFQQHTSDSLFYEWKAYESAAAGDFELAITNIDKAEGAHQEIEKEYYKLATKYGWDTAK
jgi:hypothetical protein